MCHLPPTQDDPNLLVGLDTSDDAGVYKLNSEQALVQTVDFFTPVVDDPYTFGQIAAANSLSDIYAMGGKPLTAMNLIGFPVGKLDMSILAKILQGGSDKLKEAGTILVGGHSVEDSEPKYGLSVTGIVHPDRVLSNAGAKPGDFLVLTKPLGIGIITTGIKRGIVSVEDEEQAVAVMSELNRGAAEAAQDSGVNACTDVTGFGLLGHLYEMVKASKVSAVIEASKVPVLESVWGCLRQKAIPGGTLANKRYLEDKVYFSPDVDEDMRLVLCDAITSGGLLLSIPEQQLSGLIRSLEEKKTHFMVVIGRISEQDPGTIKVNL